MQVIARCRGNYPFGSDSSQSVVYVEVLRQNLNEDQIHTYQLKSVLLKEMGSQRFIKLLKTYREGNNIMMLFQYQKTSINKCIQVMSSQSQKPNGKCNQCIHCFTSNISAIIDLLIHFQIKVDLLIQNFAVVQKEDGHFQLKLFVDPDSEFMALKLPMLDHDQIKTKMKENRAFLKEFYDSQKKRMVNDFEELLEDRMGKLDSPQITHPNFIIKGSKLIFIRDDHSPPKTHGHHHESHSIQKMQLIHEKPKVLSLKNKKTELKQKYQSKIQQIKTNLKKIESHHHPHTHQQASPPKGDLKSIQRNRKGSNAIVKKINKQIKIQQEQKIKQEHCHEPFKYTQIFDKLQKQLKKEGETKKEEEEQKNSQDSRQLKKFQENGETHSQTSQNFSRTSSSIQQSKKKKYKMKIVTSHDIQVEKVDHPQDEDISNHSQLIQKFKNLTGTPPLKIECEPKLLNDEDMEEKQVQSPLHSRKSDLGPRSSIRLIESQPQIINLKGFVNQSQQCCNISPPVKADNSPSSHKPYISSQFTDKVREVKWKAEKILRQYYKGRKQQ